MEAIISRSVPHVPWNRDKLTGQKSPLKLKEIWAIRIRLRISGKANARFGEVEQAGGRCCEVHGL